MRFNGVHGPRLERSLLLTGLVLVATITLACGASQAPAADGAQATSEPAASEPVAAASVSPLGWPTPAMSRSSTCAPTARAAPDRPTSKPPE